MLRDFLSLCLPGQFKTKLLASIFSYHRSRSFLATQQGSPDTLALPIDHCITIVNCKPWTVYSSCLSSTNSLESIPKKLQHTRYHRDFPTRSPQTPIPETRLCGGISTSGIHLQPPLYSVIILESQPLSTRRLQLPIPDIMPNESLLPPNMTNRQIPLFNSNIIESNPLATIASPPLLSKIDLNKILLQIKIKSMKSTLCLMIISSCKGHAWPSLETIAATLSRKFLATKRCRNFAGEVTIDRPVARRLDCSFKFQDETHQSSLLKAAPLLEIPSCTRTHHPLRPVGGRQIALVLLATICHRRDPNVRP